MIRSCTEGADICHVYPRPPYVNGSVNILIAQQMQYLPEFSQIYVTGDWNTLSYRETYPDVYGPADVDLTIRNRVLMALPDSLRSRLTHGPRSRLAFGAYVTARYLIRSLRPKIVAIHDDLKLSALLRPHMPIGCRLVFFQHGYSYWGLPASRVIYQYGGADTVVHLTMQSYEDERRRMHSYESAVEIIANPIDSSVFKPRSEGASIGLRASLGLPGRSLIVCFAGRLVPKKGLHIVIDSWKSVVSAYPEALLLVVGEGDRDYVERMRKTCQILGVANSVRFAGSVEHGEVHRYFQAADVGIFPTLCAEGMPLALFEAMACGLPVVASDAVGIRELLHEDALAIVTSPNIRGRFCDAILALMASPERMTRLGLNARKYVIERFSICEWTKALARMYRRELDYTRAAPAMP